MIDLETLIQKIRSNSRLRRRLTYESPLWFALLYLRHHFGYPLAPFHIEMFHLIERDEPLTVVMAFRGSGKSTILNMVNVLWSILGKPQKKFAVTISQSQEQAKNHFSNIKAELENNEWLKEDFGPFTESGDIWNKLSLELVYHEAKILSAVRNQSLRGLKHGAYRPDLIICDDVEDTLSSDEIEKLNQWLESEIMPLGTESTRLVILGNLVQTFYYDETTNQQSLILRMWREIITGTSEGMFRAYPLIDSRGRNLWPQRFTVKAMVWKLRSHLRFSVWSREYLLKCYGQGDNYPNIGFITEPDLKRHYLNWHYGENTYTYPQTPLIPQMKKYNIQAPANAIALFRGPDDPEYIKYVRNIFWEQNLKDVKEPRWLI